MDTDSKTGGSKNETQRSGAADAERRSASWSAAGSAAPRRFRPGGTGGMFAALRARESGVAAALCHRSPRRALSAKAGDRPGFFLISRREPGRPGAANDGE